MTASTCRPAASTPLRTIAQNELDAWPCVTTAMRTARAPPGMSGAGTPVPLEETDGARGALVAFHEGSAAFVRGVPLAPDLLPSPAASTFALVFPEAGTYRLFFEFRADGKTYAESAWVDVRPAR